MKGTTHNYLFPVSVKTVFWIWPKFKSVVSNIRNYNPDIKGYVKAAVAKAQLLRNVAGRQRADTNFATSALHWITYSLFLPYCFSILLDNIAVCSTGWTSSDRHIRSNMWRVYWGPALFVFSFPLKQLESNWSRWGHGVRTEGQQHYWSTRCKSQNTEVRFFEVYPQQNPSMALSTSYMTVQIIKQRSSIIQLLL